MRGGTLSSAAEPMDVTDDLRLAAAGDAPAAERLLPAVYDQLRRLAARYLRAEGGGHTLQATALVHEAYLKLVDQTRAQFQERGHFMAVAATAMRRILVDHARRRAVRRRAADAGLVLPHPAEATGSTVDFVAIDEALGRLARRDARQARVVELRYFAGLGNEEIAEILGVSETTIKADWREACAFLRRDWERGDRER